MKGICLIWSRGRHSSPSLPDRGPTGTWHLASSISHPRAEISGILVMVRRSSATSRGTAYWFQYFCFPLFGHVVFRTQVFLIVREKMSQRNLLDPKVNMALGWRSKILWVWNWGKVNFTKTLFLYITPFCLKITLETVKWTRCLDKLVPIWIMNSTNAKGNNNSSIAKNINRTKERLRFPQLIHRC